MIQEIIGSCSVGGGGGGGGWRIGRLEDWKIVGKGNPQGPNVHVYGI